MKSIRPAAPFTVLRAAVVATSLLALTACAAPNHEAAAARAAAEAAAPEDNDPLEPVNRAIHGVNQAVDHVVLRPVAYGYRAAVPEAMRMTVRNLLRHLASPVILANDILQGDVERARNTAMRLWINTTFGFGLADIAHDAGYPYHEEDFGQTLAVWGADGGPYIVLPLLGPSNARDAVGRAVDWFVDPLRMYTAAHKPEWRHDVNTGRTVATVIDTREALLDPIEEIERSSLDIYASYRSMYLQRRSAAIANREGTGMGTPGVDGGDFDFAPDEPAAAPAAQ